MPVKTVHDEELIRETAERTAEAVKRQIMENGMGSSKISKILKGIKENEGEHSHEEVPCPNCTGHNLKEVEHGKLKCTGEGCGKEFNLIPVGYLEKAGYECKNCGAPHVRPEVDNKADKCLFCGIGDDFIKTNKFKIYNGNKKEEKKK